jgi:hypothetical protein
VERPEEFTDRFFERQRRESLARIDRFESRRRARRLAAPVAAVLLLAAVIVGGKLWRGGDQPAEQVDWLFAWSAPAEEYGYEYEQDDPLAPFGPWETEEAAANGNGELFLPPLPEELWPDELAVSFEADDEA